MSNAFKDISGDEIIQIYENNEFLDSNTDLYGRLGYLDTQIYIEDYDPVVVLEDIKYHNQHSPGSPTPIPSLGLSFPPLSITEADLETNFILEEGDVWFGEPYSWEGYRLAGADAEHFGITFDGKLVPLTSLDYEIPQDENKDNIYVLEIQGIASTKFNELAGVDLNRYRFEKSIENNYQFKNVTVEVLDTLGNDRPYFIDSQTYSFTLDEHGYWSGPGRDREGNLQNDFLNFLVNEDNNKTIEVKENFSADNYFYSFSAADFDQDSNSLIFSLEGEDASYFNLTRMYTDNPDFGNRDFGALQFKISPDYELKSVYDITIKVTDDEGLNISQDLTVDIKDVAPKNDIPTITSSDGFPNKHVIWDANLPISEPVYDFDVVHPNSGTLLVSLVADSDDSKYFHIDPETYEIFFKNPPNDILKPSQEITDQFHLDDDVNNTINPQYKTTIKAIKVAGNENFNTEIYQDLYVTVESFPDIKIHSGSSDYLYNTPTTENNAHITLRMRENMSTENTIYEFQADGNDLNYSLEGADASSFNLIDTQDPNQKQIKFKKSPDFETKSQPYEITIKGSDDQGFFTSQNITVEIVDRLAKYDVPTITSSNGFQHKHVIWDNSRSISDPVYDFDAVHPNPSGGSLNVYLDPDSLDSEHFYIDPDTYEVFFESSPDFQKPNQLITGQFEDDDEITNIIQPQYATTIIAEKIAGKAKFNTKIYQDLYVTLRGFDSENTITDAASDILVNIESDNNGQSNDPYVPPNLPPLISSSEIATAIDENTASSTVIYSAAGTDESAILWSLKEELDYDKFSIDSNGNVSLASIPDYEVDGNELKFTVSASDGTLTTDKTVTLGINDVFENELVLYNENETVDKTLSQTDKRFFSIEHLQGFDNKDFSVRIPKRLRSILEYVENPNSDNFGWITFKNGKSQSDLIKGVFRFRAKSNDGTVKHALKFKIKPESHGPTFQEQAINRLNSWNLGHTSRTWTRTDTDKEWSQITDFDSALDNIFNKFKFNTDQQENNVLDKFKKGTAKIAANTNDKMVIIDSSSSNDSIIIDSEIKEVNASRQAQIKQALELEGLTIADDVTIETPINELDFSVDTLANGSAIVQLQLEESDQNIDNIIKTNIDDESFIFNSKIIRYDEATDGNFESWLNNLTYNIYYYEDSSDSQPDLTGITLSKNSSVEESIENAGLDYDEIKSFIDGSAYLIDKDGDGDIELVSTFLLDQGFFDTDRSEGLIRDPIILIDSPVPDAPTVNGSSLVNDATPNFSGTTDNAGNIITVYAENGETLATTIARADKTWSIEDGNYITSASIADGQQTLAIAASDSFGESVTETFNITVDTIGPIIISETTASPINENVDSGSLIYTVEANDGSGTGVKADSFAITGADAGFFTINSTTGDITINGSPDYESKPSYSFTVAATDEANNTTTKDITLLINNVDEGSSSFELRGAAKVGETMTADYNLIETAVDADNDSGALTGSYNYKWQLSDDGGADWTTVATDADYTIRLADVDKQLRALVTYTDESGTYHKDIASSNSLDTVSLAAVAVDTNDSLINYQYRLKKSGTDLDLGGVLGYSNDSNTRTDYSDIAYDLIVEAKTLTNGDINGTDVTWDLESFDVTLDFNYDLFSNWADSGVSATFGDEINTATSYDYTVNDLTADSVRITGATLSNLNEETGIQNTYKELFTLRGLKFDTSVTKSLADDGVAGNEFVDVNISTNIYDTVVANYQSTDEDTNKDNAYIRSLAELGYTNINDGGSIDGTNTTQTFIHNAYVDLDEQGTTLYTQRTIGSNDKTYLIRDGSTVDAKAWWANLGNYGIKVEDLDLKAVENVNLKIMELSVGDNGVYDAVSSYEVDTLTSLNGSDLIEGGSVDFSDGSKTSWDGSNSENIELNFKVQVNGRVGQTLGQLNKSFYKLEGTDSEGYEDKNSESDTKLSNNMITFQGDLNYDGRVSIKDLAFLNAGKLNATQNGDQAADDVDANYDGKINTTDLAILDRDWGGTIHSDSLTTDGWGSQSWSSLTYMDGDVINNIADTELDYENSSFDAQKLIDSDHPDPLAGDIYSGEGNLYTGSNLYADDTKDFGTGSDPIIGYYDPS